MASPVTYPPLDQLKPVADGVWIVDSGPHRMLGIPMPVRMAVVRLASGDLILHSPTRYHQPLRRQLEEVGRIRHLLAPNIAHWSYLQTWQRECPGTVTWAAPGLRERRQVRQSGLRIDHDLSGRAPAEWADEIEQVVVPGGGGFTEVALFHRKSRTLLLTDLVVNVETEKLPAPMRLGTHLVGSAAPDGQAPIYLRLVINMKRSQAAPAARRLIDLAPERVIFSHGRWFERDGTLALARSLRWLTR
ncbi:DUF4336 domain-containing protein [Geminicoccus harenae]|uniref:DUF4336 domain-containing protein n=1 Tax=Geminicoccus harenae TaxID=2498453 RepID=UPI00168AB442|nr:DUF4336 domain-containing protein [Geminicoccus harenae]